MKNNRLSILTIALLTLYAPAFGITTPLFFHTPSFWGTPRIAKDHLWSYDVRVTGDKTRDGFNRNGHEVNVFQIYGPEDLRYAAQGVDQEILNRVPKSILNDLPTSTSIAPFGRVLFSGALSVVHLEMTLAYTIGHGFFGQLVIPFTSVHARHLNVQDCTTRNSAGNKALFDQWGLFMNDFKENLAHYGISVDDNNRRGIGDIMLMLGWAYTNEKHTYTDFFDITLQAGIIIPSAQRKNPDILFDIPLGYNGHVGVPLSAQASVGLYDWLTLGCYAAGIFLLPKNECLRIKTAFEQNGFIKLTKGHARVHPGSIALAGVYVSSDHVAGGFSWIVGYGYYHQHATHATPLDNNRFTPAIVNSDAQLKPWTAHAIHAVIEYDCATIQTPNRPRIAIVVDSTVRGKRVARTSMTGLSIALDTTW